jgi:hypothetical protein
VDPERILDELLDLADRLHLTVVHDALTLSESPAHCGYCRVYDKRKVILDGGAPVAERISALVGALRGFDVTGVYLSPWIRELVGARVRSFE